MFFLTNKEYFFFGENPEDIVLVALVSFEEWAVLPFISAPQIPVHVSGAEEREICLPR